MAEALARTLLQQHALFAGLDSDSMDRLSRLAVRRRAGRGEVLFSQGDPGDALFGLISGKVHVTATAADGRQALLNILEPGETFGEIALLDGMPRTASAIAVDDSDLLVIARTGFLQLLAADPELARHLLEALCARLRWTTEMLEDNTFLAVPARLAKRILHLLAVHADRGDGDENLLSISQEELASFLGVSRQIVNRTLQEWRQAGHIEVLRGRIRVLDTEGLLRSAAETQR